MKKLRIPLKNGLMCLLILLSLFSFLTPHATHAYFVSEVSATAGLDLTLGNIQLETAQSEMISGDSKTVIDGKVTNIGSLDGKLAYAIQVREQETEKLLSPDELNNYFSDATFALTLNTHTFPVKVNEINDGKHQFFSTDQNTFLLNSGDSAYIKLSLNEMSSIEKNLTVEVSYLLIQSNAEEVTDPLFYDTKELKGTLEKSNSANDWPIEEQFTQEDNVKYAIDPQYYIAEDERMVMNDVYLYVTSEQFDSTTRVDIKNNTPFSIKAQKFYPDKNGFRLTLIPDENLGNGTINFHLTFYNEENQIGKIDNHFKESFSRRIVLNTDSLTHNNRFEKSDIKADVDGKEIRFGYLSSKNINNNTEILPADSFVPKLVEVGIDGGNSELFDYDIIKEGGEFSHIEVWQKNYSGEQQDATLIIRVTGQNGNIAVIKRRLVSEAPPDSSGAALTTFSNSQVEKTVHQLEDKENSPQETEKMKDNVVEEIQAEEKANSTDAADSKERVSENTKELEPETEVLENDAIDDHPVLAQEHNWEPRQSVSPFDYQAVGLPDYFLEWLRGYGQGKGQTFSEYVKANIVPINEWAKSVGLEEVTEESESVPVILSLSQHMEEDALDEIIEWLEETTRTEIEVMEMKEEYHYMFSIKLTK